MRKERDGGYHAIKGFAYQFDASLMRIFENLSSVSELEGKQDLSVENYHIQVKHRSEKFSVSAVTSAVQLMFRQFQQDNSSQFILHCHFSDQEDYEELTRVLTSLSSEATDGPE